MKFCDVWHRVVELGGLIKFVRPFLTLLSKAKAAKMVRTLLDLFLDMEASTGREVDWIGLGFCGGML